MKCYCPLIRKLIVGEIKRITVIKKKTELEVTVDNYLEVSDRKFYGIKEMLTKVLLPQRNELYQEVNEHTTSFIKYILLLEKGGGRGQLI